MLEHSKSVLNHVDAICFAVHEGDQSRLDLAQCQNVIYDPFLVVCAVSDEVNKSGATTNAWSFVIKLTKWYWLVRCLQSLSGTFPPQKSLTSVQ